MAETKLAHPFALTVDHQLREIADELQGLMLLSAEAEGVYLERIQRLFTERLSAAKQLGYRARFSPGGHGFVLVEWEAL